MSGLPPWSRLFARALMRANLDFAFNGVKDVPPAALLPPYPTSSIASVDPTIQLTGANNAAILAYDTGTNKLVQVKPTANGQFYRTDPVSGLPIFGRLEFPTPEDNGMIGWSMDPAQTASAVLPAFTVGQLQLVYVATLSVARQVSYIHYEIGALGASLTAGQNLLGLFKSDGTLLGQTADLTAAWNTGTGATGARKDALTAPVTVSGKLYVGALANGTTSPRFYGASRAAAAGGGANMNCAAGTGRLMAYNTGLTALPSPYVPGSAALSTQIMPLFGIS